MRDMTFAKLSRIIDSRIHDMRELPGIPLTHCQLLRTFLVIPDAHSGGADFECFVVASTPQEACQHLAKYLGCEGDTFKLETDPPFTKKQRLQDKLWIVREVSRALSSPIGVGVVPWDNIQCTFWRLCDAAA